MENWNNSFRKLEKLPFGDTFKLYNECILSKTKLGDSLAREFSDSPSMPGANANPQVPVIENNGEQPESLEYLLQESGSIVHDMNNQLAAIVAMSDLLLKTMSAEPTLSSGLGRIQESARNLSELADKWQLLLRKHTPSEAPPSASPLKRESGRSTLNGVYPGKPAHILLVDDEEVVSAATEEMLKRLGYKVTNVSSGSQGIAFYQAHWQEVGLVILDMVMPEMDGAQVFGALKEINPNVDVLVSSGYSHNETAQGMIDAGARGYLQKPFRINDLSSIISRILPLPKLSAEKRM